MKKKILFSLIGLIFTFLISFPSFSSEPEEIYSNWNPVAPPDIGSSWRLYGVQSISANEGWAVGWGSATYESNYEGVILRYSNGSWFLMNPPYISSSWGLVGVNFTSSNEGWAVGWDRSYGRGVLLHFLNGSWNMVLPPSIAPPEVSLNWGLVSVSFSSAEEGWAVGKSGDWTNAQGILLHYLNGS